MGADHGAGAASRGRFAPLPCGEGVLSRLEVALYLATLALLPWAWFPPFPWLQPLVQWSDVVFAATALCWLLGLWQRGGVSSLVLQPVHGWMVLYLGWAAVTLCVASPDKVLGALKLVGMGELVLLAVITADLTSRPGMLAAAARVVAWTALATGVAAVIGLAIHFGGSYTPLIGTYGDLQPSPRYARVEAGLRHPNMLASYAIFAACVIAHPEANLPAPLRRVAQAAIWGAALMTFSRAILGLVVSEAIRLAHTPRQRIGAGCLAAGCIMGIIALTFGNLHLDPTRPLAARWDARRGSPRLQAHRSSWQTLVSHPLFGSGVGQAPGRYAGQTFDAHLTLLSIPATLGLPALVAMVGLWVALWRDRERPTDIATWSGLAGLGVDSFAASVEDFRHLWVLIGLAARCQVGNTRAALRPRKKKGPGGRAPGPAPLAQR